MGTVAPSYKKVFVVLLCILTKLWLAFVNTEYHDHILSLFITVFPLLDDKERQYWCWKLLESAYQCFKVLRVHKLLQLPDVYSHDILQCLSGCLTKLQTKSTNVVSW